MKVRAGVKVAQVVVLFDNGERKRNRIDRKPEHRHKVRRILVHKKMGSKEQCDQFRCAQKRGQILDTSENPITQIY
jgi:hypothetical protein